MVPRYKLAKMELGKAFEKIDVLKLKSEIDTIKAACDGMERADFFVFYKDAEGKQKVLFLEDLDRFPFDLKQSVKKLLVSALQRYNYYLAQINNL